MKLTEDTKTLLFVGVCLVLIYLIYRNQSPIHNEGNLEMESAEEVNAEMEQAIQELAEEEELGGAEEHIEYKTYAPEEALGKKFNRRNKSKSGKKKVSFKDGVRGVKGPQDWHQYFDNNNNVLGAEEGDGFKPVDESDGAFHSFQAKGAPCGSNQNCSVEDLFNADNYLPQETNDEWFQTQKEPVSVKNRHLINVTRPIGINTIGTSLANASRDIRGNEACPKFVVSPFLNSSIEPDNNIRAWA